MAILEPTRKANTLEMMKRIKPQSNSIMLEQMKRIIEESLITNNSEKS